MPRITIGTVAGTDRSTGTLSLGNLKLATTIGTTNAFRSINASGVVSGAGPYYFRTTGVRWIEAYLTAVVTTSTVSPVLSMGAGFTGPTASQVIANNASVRPSGGAWQSYVGTTATGATFGTFTGLGQTYTVGAVVDINNKKVRFYVNGVQGPELDCTALTWTAGVNITGNMITNGEAIEMNYGYDQNGAYRAATYLSTYLTDYPTAIPWQDEKFHPASRPVISPRPVAHIRL